MKKWKVALVMLSALCLVSGCGKKEAGTSKAVQNKDYVYSFESFADKMEGRDFGQSIATKDRLVFMEYRYEEGTMPIARYETAMLAGEVEAVEAVVAEEVIIAEDEAATEGTEATTEEIVAEETAEEAVATNDAMIEADMSVDMPVEDFDMEGEVYENQMKTFVTFAQYDFDMNPIAEFEVEQTGSVGFNGMGVDNNGNIYTLLVEYGVMTESGNYKDLYTLIGYTQTGEEIFRLPLGRDVAEDEYYYVNDMLCVGENLVLWAMSNIEVYSFTGELIKSIDISNTDMGQLFAMRDGSLASLWYGETNTEFVKINLETGEISEKMSIPYNGYNFSHYAGVYCDLMLVDSIGVYTYNFGDESHKKIMDFVDSDLSSSSCYSLLQLTEDSFFAWTYNDIDYKSECGIFTKVDPATIKDKEIITLGTLWMDSAVRRRVVDFNKASDTYRIRVEEYSQYNTSDDYTLGLSRLNTDIASGNAPDIMCLTGEMPVESYMSKGLFVDLKTFVDNDPDLAMEDYMPEVVEAFSQDGKWYQMVPSYFLYTVFGKTADVGAEPGLTFEELEALRTQKGGDVQVFSERTKTGVLNDAIMMNSDEYINWETGECYFNTPEFIGLLEFVNEFPSEINYEELYSDPQYWEKQETMFRDGQALLQPYTISDFRDFLYCEQGTFGEQITAVGFPVNEGTGNAYMCNFSFAVSAKSKYQDVAWEFLRYYLMDEYQDSIEYGWPIKLSSLDKRMQKAQEKPYYEDENGNKVEYDETYYVGGMEIVLDTLTQADCERVVSFLKSADHVYNYDRNIISILEEECAAYFEGQKSAKEVSDIIQSRIHIYVNENL